MKEGYEFKNMINELMKEVSSLEKDDKIKMFLNIIEMATDGYFDWHIKDDFEYLSPKFKKQLGYEVDEMEHHPSAWQSLINKEDMQTMFSEVQKHFDSKGEYVFMTECRYTHKDGHEIWILCRGEVIEWDEEDKPVRMIGTHTDITKFK